MRPPRAAPGPSGGAGLSERDRSSVVGAVAEGFGALEPLEATRGSIDGLREEIRAAGAD